jgi:hypothetical protein
VRRYISRYLSPFSAGCGDVCQLNRTALLSYVSTVCLLMCGRILGVFDHIGPNLDHFGPHQHHFGPNSEHFGPNFERFGIYFAHFFDYFGSIFHIVFESFTLSPMLGVEGLGRGCVCGATYHLIMYKRCLCTFGTYVVYWVYHRG